MRHTWLQLGNKRDDLVTTYTQHSYCYQSQRCKYLPETRQTHKWIGIGVEMEWM